MKRHPIGLYVIGVVELVAGFLLTWGAISLCRQIARSGYPRADDLLAATALSVGGVGILAAGLGAILVPHLSLRIARGMRIAGIAAETCMMLAGAGIYWVARRHGGDWAGIGYLAGTVFLALGALLVLLSWLGIRLLRRLETARLSPTE